MGWQGSWPQLLSFGILVRQRIVKEQPGNPPEGLLYLLFHLDRAVSTLFLGQFARQFVHHFHDEHECLCIVALPLWGNFSRCLRCRHYHLTARFSTTAKNALLRKADIICGPPSPHSLRCVMVVNLSPTHLDGHSCCGRVESGMRGRYETAHHRYTKYNHSMKQQRQHKYQQQQKT